MPKPTGIPEDDVDIIIEEWGRADQEIDLAILELHARISRVNHFGDKLGEAICREYGFGVGECDLLLTLRRGGPPYTRRPTDLSQASLVTSGATTGRIDRLVALGLVDRVGSTTDRRAAHVHLTPHGWEVTTRLVERLLKDGAFHRAGPFTEAEIATTISVLRRIGEALGDVRAAEPPVDIAARRPRNPPEKAAGSPAPRRAARRG